MKKVMLVLLLVLAAVSANAQLLSENVEYITGRLTSVSGGDWVWYGGDTITNYIQVTAGSLSYSGYPLSGVGNKITIRATTVSAEDAFSQFIIQLPDVNIYASFLLNITSSTMSPDTSTNGDYFLALLDSSHTNYLNGRVSAKLSTIPDKYKIGIRASSSNTTVWYANDLDINSTYLIVLNYNLISGTTNDVLKLWINPGLTGSEPVADLTQTSALDLTNIARIAIRQGYTASPRMQTPDADIDGIIVGNSWNDITGVEGQPSISSVNFSLLPCLPNPANKSTKFSFSLSQNGKVELSVFNVLGQKVATLYKGSLASGKHTINWNLKDAQDRFLPNGVYFYQLTDGSRNSTRRLLILK